MPTVDQLMRVDPEPWIAVVEPTTRLMTAASADTPKVREVGERWARRPWLSIGIRAAAYVAPIVAAVAVSLVVARQLPTAPDLSALLLQWALLLVIGGVVAKGARLATKRLLPLSALFELSLIFPDQAPSRVATALRRPSDEELARIVERTKRHGLPTDATEAATTVLTLVTALSQHDRLTRGHSERVRVYATMIAEEMRLSAAEVSAVQWAGLLHDVGKLGVDEAILNKPGRLTEDEYTLVQTHTLTGAVMVEPLREWLGDAVDAAVQHHERWDGTGYPYGLAGEEIGLAARIVAVADVYDVITAKRSYKDPLPASWARREIADGAGTQFDPKVVRAFLAISLNQMKVATGPFAWMAQIPILASLPMASMAAPMTVIPAAKAATAAAMVAAATTVAPASMPHVDPAPVELEVARTDAAAVSSSPQVNAGRGAEPVPAAAAPLTSKRTNTTSVVTPRPSAPVTATTAPQTTAPQTTAPQTTAPQTTAPKTTADVISDEAALELRDRYAAERLEVEQKAASRLADAEAAHADEIAKIDRELREDLAKLDAEFADDLLAIAELTAETNRDIAELELKRAADLAELAAELDEDLGKADDRRAEDLANAKDGAEATEARDDHAEKTAKLREDYAQDVAKVRADASEDIAKKRARLTEKRENVLREFDEKQAALVSEAAEDRSAADADLALDVAKITADRDKEIDELTAELAEDLAKL